MVESGPEAVAGELPVSFSDAEMRRRRSALDDLAAEAGVGAVLLWGAQRSGAAIPWLTRWPVTAEAHVLVLAGEAPLLFVSYPNHLPNAGRIAAAEVRPGGRGTPEAIRKLLVDRRVQRLGVVGALPWTQAAAFDGLQLADLTPLVTRLRLVKSEEELAALRLAAAVTDEALAAMCEGPLVGCSEHDLQARIQASYLRAGAAHHVSYLAVTPLRDPDRCVPGQWPTARRVGSGDVVTCELSAAVAPDLAGQVLRTFVTGPPTALLESLHAVAEECFSAIEALLRPGTTAEELVAASSLVEQAGFTTVDDVVHGYGGGYLAPVLSTPSRRPRSEAPGFVLAEGMTLVVQPNVVTPDHRLGVQTGELLEVTAEGPRRLHRFPRGLQLAS